MSAVIEDDGIVLAPLDRPLTAEEARSLAETLYDLAAELEEQVFFAQASGELEVRDGQW